MTVFQQVLPEDMRGPVGLPGTKPERGPWLRVDEAYAGQMTIRDRLVAEKPDDVMARMPGADAAVAELLEMSVDFGRAHLGFVAQGDQVRRPDGALVDMSAPLPALARLFQNDFVVLQKQGDEHVLTAAALCFPASWTLREKVGRPLMRIHAPVDSYDARIGRGVQRMFDAVAPGRPLWRFNRLWYADPALFQPRSESDPRGTPGDPVCMRSERQTILRLPKTGACVFVIHTYVLDRSVAEMQVQPA